MLMSYSDCTRKSLKQNVGFKSEGINSDNNSETLPILYDLQYIFSTQTTKILSTDIRLYLTRNSGLNIL